MRDPSEWSVGERELFAASALRSDELTRQVLEDYTAAPIDEKLRATVGLLKKVTLDHASLGPGDVRAVLRLGVSKAAVADAMEVAFLFSVYDRMADAWGGTCRRAAAATTRWPSAGS